MQNINEKTITTALEDLAIERLVAALPQKDLLPALGLVSMKTLSQMLGIHGSTMRYHMAEGRIPRPTIRLKQRPYYTRVEAEAIADAWRERPVFDKNREK